MSKYNLIHFPDPLLSAPCEQVTEFNTELHELLDAMHKEMLKYNGVGLSANQVGVSKRVFILQETHYNAHLCKHDAPDGHNSSCIKNVIEFINPVILEQSDTLVNEMEGCLSAPGVYVPIVRPEEVLVEAYNRHGELFVGVLLDIEARCAIHELEHLDGKSFLDKTNRQNRKGAYKKLGIK